MIETFILLGLWYASYKIGIAIKESCNWIEQAFRTAEGE
jgi:hypothetical protein